MFGLLVNMSIAGVILTSAMFADYWRTRRSQAEYAAKHRLDIRASRIRGFQPSHRFAS